MIQKSIKIRLFALVLVVGMLINWLPLRALATPNVYYADALNWAVSKGIVNGPSDSEANSFEWFRPADTVNRAEMAKMMVMAMQLPISHVGTQTFFDVSPLDWYHDYVETGFKNYLFGGYTDGGGVSTGLFGPRDEVTRGALAKVLTQSFGLEMSACSRVFEDIDYFAWYSTFMDAACAAGIIRGDASGRARPGDSVTRAEFVTMLYRAAGEMKATPTPPGEETQNDTDQITTGTSQDSNIAPVDNIPDTPTVQEPDTSITEQVIDLPPVDFPDFDAVTYNNFARLNAPTGQCPDGSCAVHVAQFAITPTIDNIILRRLTLTNDDNSNNFSGRFGTFFLVHDGQVIDTASFNDTDGNSDGVVEFSGFSHVLTKGKRHKLNVLAEIHEVSNPAQSGSFIKLYVENSSAIEAFSNTNGLSVGANFIVIEAGATGPYIQNHIIRKSYPIVQNANDSIPTRIFNSLSDTKVYRFKMTAHPDADIEWKKLTFNIEESDGISSSNYKLYVENSHTALNTAAAVSSGKLAIIPASPVRIPAGQTVTFVLKADLDITNTAQSQNLAITLTAAADTSLITSSEAALSSSDFVWSDMSDNNHSISTLDWTNGFEVDTFDSETVNIGYQGIG